MHQPALELGMSLLDVKVQIAGRTYPLQIEAIEEEALRASVKSIKEELEMLESSYGVKDKQDLLAMLLIQYGNRLRSTQEKTLISKQSEQLIEQLSEQLKTINY